MERADAERVFALVAEIGGDLRGRLIAERWWLVWVAVGVHMLAGSLLLQWLIWRGADRATLAAVLAALAAILFLLIRLIHRRSGGRRTSTETCLWWVWTTHILCTFAFAVLEAIAGLPPLVLAPAFALLCAFAFSMMAMVTDRFFLAHAVLFVCVAAAMTAWREWQFVIYGVAWFAVLVALGVYQRLTAPPRLGRHL
jgi:hypothetical protein